MSTRKIITPQWITRGEDPYQGQASEKLFPEWLTPPFAIIPKLPVGWATTKIFYLPFTIPDYAEMGSYDAMGSFDEEGNYNENPPALTYANVLERVRWDIKGGRYNNPGSAYGFGKNGKLIKNLKSIEEQQAGMLKELLERPFDFFEGQDPLIQAHRRWFAGLIEQSWYGQTPDIRKEAENIIKNLLKRPIGLENKKVLIPSYLYLDGLVEYVHGITLVLKKSLDLPRGKRDPRIKTLTDGEQSLLGVGRCRELSEKITASGLYLKFATFKTMLEEEGKILRKPTNAHRHLIFKLTPK